MAEESRIGLALSGGGSRAIAFHLGCLRALHDRGVLERLSVLSAVSGGSLIAALWAYSDEPFEEFDRRVTKVLRRGLVWGIARHTLLSPETFRIVGTILTSGLLHLTGRLLRCLIALAGLLRIRGPRLRRIARAVSAPLRRFSSRTTAFERYLRKSFFGDTKVDQVARPGVAVVINAAELRTGTAFRFGSGESGTWRLGKLVETPRVARAVAASAAFPAFLPSFDLNLAFQGRDGVANHRVIVTDGGVYDNLGISCMLPGRSSEFSTNAHAVDFIISCDAGQGMPSGQARPYSWSERMLETVNTIHRRTHTQAYDLLHRMAANKEIAGFLLPYLGQIDARLPHQPEDLVPRGSVMDYPTDFSPMPVADIERLTRRGEQLTALLLEHYAPLL